MNTNKEILQQLHRFNAMQSEEQNFPRETNRLKFKIDVNGFIPPPQMAWFNQYQK
jgi:hypothetical protein